MGADSDHLVVSEFLYICVCIRRKACEVTEKLLFTHFSTLTRVLKQSNHAWNFLRECYFHLYT